MNLVLVAARFAKQHRFFVTESRGYIGPYSLRDRIRWPKSWLRFMWASRFDIIQERTQR